MPTNKHGLAHANRADMLIDKIGFNGLTVADGNGIQLVKTFREYCETLEDIVKLTLEEGIDCELDAMLESSCRRIHGEQSFRLGFEGGRIGFRRRTFTNSSR
jgi:hypothetical protein